MSRLSRIICFFRGHRLVPGPFCPPLKATLCSRCHRDIWELFPR